MPPISDAEWKVMEALWRKHPASARQVLEQIEDDTHWAYTTVKTMLSRLMEKGVLSVTKEGNTSFYQPVITRAQARRTALRSLVDKAFDGAFGPLIHFLLTDERLSSKDRAELERLLDEERRKNEG